MLLDLDRFKEINDRLAGLRVCLRTHSGPYWKP
jgi:hypothetical protein